MRDWNKDEKIDRKDCMHDYMLYSEMSKNSGANTSDSGSGILGVGIGMLIFGIVIIFLKAIVG